MTTTEKRVFTQEEQERIDNNRSINVDNDWWHECTIEGFSEDMEAIGVSDFEFSFSGFWSQGDGASFTGSVSNLEKFLVAVTDLSPLFIEMIQEDISIGFRRTSHHYCHENTCTTNISWDGEDKIVLLDKLELQIEFEMAPIIAKIEKQIEEWREGKCKEFYRTLEKEYDFLTTDEEVWETLNQ